MIAFIKKGGNLAAQRLAVRFLILQLDNIFQGDVIELTCLKELSQADGLLSAFNSPPIFAVLTKRFTECFACQPL